MSKTLQEIFLITSETDYLPFFRRSLGDSGRDIAAVKKALGMVHSPLENGEDSPILEDNSIGRPWFDCITNETVSGEKLKLFDKKMKIELMQYQIANQFIMISYYFEKYCVSNIIDKVTLLQQIDAANNLFEMEFGSIGESTLACMHEWRPNSVAYNQSFVSDIAFGQDPIVDQIPVFFYNLITQEAMETPPSSKIETFTTSRTPGYSQSTKLFKSQMHSNKWFYERIKKNFTGASSDLSDLKPVNVEYSKFSTTLNILDSILFTAANEVISSNVEKDIQELKSTELYRRLSPMLEPDHLSDPDPFPAGGDIIGFFDRTEFTLENLPDFTNLSDEYKRKIEDEALLKVLRHYKKPIIWFSDNDFSEEDKRHFSNQEEVDRYSDITGRGLNYKITTTSAISEFVISEGDYDAIYGNHFIALNDKRIIRFIEFRTPSLRPGDVYRAYFEISESFLDSIKSGTIEESFAPYRAYDNQALLDQVSTTQSEIENTLCAENASTEEDSQVKYEKYKAFAMKKKLELSREIRNKAIEASVTTPEGVNIDLGVFGNIPFVNILDDTSLSSEDILTGGFGELASLITSYTPNHPSPDEIEITMKQLEEGIVFLEKIFRSDKVQQDLKTFKVKTKNQFLQAPLEADFLASIPAWLRSLASVNSELRSQIRLSDFTLEELLDGEEGGLWSGSLRTRFIIKFAENKIRIQSIHIESSRLPSRSVEIYKEGGNYKSLKPPLTRPRTANYLRNIFNMVPLKFVGWQQLASDFIGQSGDPCAGEGAQPTKGAALILKYTVDNKGVPLKFEKDFSSYNPFHDWKDNLLEREELKRTTESWANLKSGMLSEVTWGTDESLPLIGPKCDLDDLYKEIFNKKNLSKLLCNFLTCVNLPDVNIQFPNLTLPELPKRPIFEYPGVDENWAKKLVEVIESILLRVLCSFISNILDILSTPFCEEELSRSVYGSASSVAAPIQAAFASAMLDTGIAPEKSNNANQLISELVNILTPREICALISGQPVTSEVYAVVSNLARNHDLEEELETREGIINLFTTLGNLIPDEICNGLRSNNIIGTVNCTEETGKIAQIRNIASQGEVDPEKVDQAIALLEKNMMDKAKAFEILTGQKSIADLFPDIDMSEFQSPVLKRTSKTIANATLDIVKRSFLTSMSGFVPSLHLDFSNLVSIEDTNYDAAATMKFLRAANNLSKLQGFDLTDSEFANLNLTIVLRRRLLSLCDEYEKVVDEFGNPGYETADGRRVEAYKSQTEDFEIVNNEAGQTQDRLKYSTVFPPEGATEEEQEEYLNGMPQGRFTTARSQIDITFRYRSVFELLFPIEIEFVDEETGESSIEQITNFNQFQFQAKYRNPYLDSLDPRYIQLNLSYLAAINRVASILQQHLQESIEATFKSVNTEKLLENIKDFFNIELEALRDTSSRYLQYIKTTKTSDSQQVILEHPAKILQTKMLDKTMSQNYIKNKTTIDDQFFLGSADFPIETITLCEPVPEKYQDVFNESRLSNPLRRMVFREQLSRISKKYYLDYFLEDSMTPYDDLNYITPVAPFAAQEHLFLEVTEGIIEQLVSYMGQSKIFEDTIYLQRLDSKLRARTFYDDQGDRVCKINPKGTINEGPIKFDELITDTFQQQYFNELSSPDNNPMLMDYATIGPFQKAMMTTVFLGFIRIVCLEALLKGALAYSTWDIDFVKSDPMFRKYLYRLVENNIEKQKTFKEYNTFVDDVLYKLTGTNNRGSSIKIIVDEELDGTLSSLSKILFEHTQGEDHSQWFLEKMIFVDAPYKRAPNNSRLWLSELKEQDVQQYRKNSFTYLERYIRTSGEWPSRIGSAQELTEASTESLYNFIRYNSNAPPYEQSFINKLYDQEDPDFLSVPLVLDVPTASEVESFDLENPDNVNVQVGNPDDDQWPNKELWSLEDFSALIQSIFDGNTGVQKYVFHLLKKHWDPSSPFHGKPKTLKKRLPIKAVKRSRTYYKFTKSNIFTPSSPGQIDHEVEFAGGGYLPRAKESQKFVRYLNGDGYSVQSQRDDASPTTFDENLTETVTFPDRYYVASIPGDEALDENTENHYGLEASRTPGSVRTTLNPYDSNVEITDEDVLDVVDGDWVPNGLTPNQRVYINPAGQVSESEWDTFVNQTNEIIEEEYWEESIIDLVGQAAPIFNQPAESGINPLRYLDSPSARTAASSLYNAMLYTGDNSIGSGTPEGGYGRFLGGENFYHMIQEPQDQGESGRIADGDSRMVLNSVDWTPINETDGIGYGYFDRAPYFHNKTAVGRGMGPSNINFKISEPHANIDDNGRNFRSKGYAYFNSDLKPIFDPEINNGNGAYRVDPKTCGEILGEDDYKIPLRIAITQVKDKNGNVKKVFARYIIPKVVTFSETDNETNNKRAAYTNDAIARGAKGYAKFIDDTWRETVDGAQNREITAARSKDEYDATSPDNSSDVFNVFDGSDYKIKRNRFLIANHMFGIGHDQDNNPGYGGYVPLITRQAWHAMGNRHSYGVQFLSVSKIWSKAAHYEANRQEGHFGIDAEDSFVEFDKIFTNGPGNLMRPPKRAFRDAAYGFQELVNQQGYNFQERYDNIADNFYDAADLDRNTFNYTQADLDAPLLATDLSIEKFAHQIRFYDRASRHALYDMGVKQMFNQDQEAGHVTVGNMVGWFAQRRSDGFYGATSRHCARNQFSIGNNFNFSHENNSLFGNEIEDYACGPSLFFSDGRINSIEYQQSIINYRKDDQSIDESSESYESFRNNIHELVLNFRDCNKFRRQGTLDSNVIDDDNNVRHEAFLRHAKEYSQRPPTLATTYFDVRKETTAINGFAFQLALILPESNQPRSQWAVYYSGRNRAIWTFQHADLGSGELTLPDQKSVELLETVDISMNIPRNQVFSGTNTGPYFGDEDEIDSFKRKLVKNIQDSDVIKSYFDQLSEESLNYLQLLDRLSDQHNVALRWVDDLLDRLLAIQSGMSDSDAGLIDALQIKHGIRMNLVLQDSFATETSTIENPSSTYRFFQKLWTEDSEVSEEERIGMQSLGSSMISTVPIAFYERGIKSTDPCEPPLSAGILRIPDIVRSRDKEMMKKLSEDEEFKTFFEFSFPYRRFASLLTVHSTSMLAGYSTMPTVLTSTKSSLAGIFELMATPETYSQGSEAQFGPELNNAEISAMMGAGFPAGGESPDCFSAGFDSDWWDMIAEMIKQMIIYFPSVILRGIADQLDPAYKEMKSHFYACETRDITFRSVGHTAGGGKTEFGLRGSERQRKEYIPINLGLPYDAGKGFIRLLPPGSDSGVYLAKTIDRMIGYIIGGPRQLIDASYAFQIPCKDKNETGDFRNWSKYKIGQFGRYGHPLTLFTALALPTKMLPRDLEYKNQVCQTSDFRRRNIPIVPCEPEEE